MMIVFKATDHYCMENDGKNTKIFEILLQCCLGKLLSFLIQEDLKADF